MTTLSSDSLLKEADDKLSSLMASLRMPADREEHRAFLLGLATKLRSLADIVDSAEELSRLIKYCQDVQDASHG